MKLKKAQFGIIGILVSLLLISFSGCYFLPEEEETLEVPALIESDEELYATTVVERKDIVVSLDGMGSVVPSEVVMCRFGSGGKLKNISGNIGNQIKAGDVLAEIEIGDIESSINKQELEVERRSLRLEQSKHNVENQIKSCQDELVQKRKIKSQLEEKQKEIEADYITSKEIFDVGGISKKELDVAKKQVEDNKLQIEQINGEIQMTNDKIEELGTGYDIKNNEIDYEEACIELDNLKDKVKDSKIYAPCDGTIVYKTSKLGGEYVSSDEAIYQIAKNKEFYVEYTDELAGQFKVGSEVILSVRNKDYKGKVVMNPMTAPKEESKTYEKTARFCFDNIDEISGGLRKGDMVVIKMIKAERKNVLAVPTDVVKNINGKNYVYVLENDIRVQKNVEVGLYNNAFTEITSGLDEGEIIILQ